MYSKDLSITSSTSGLAKLALYLLLLKVIHYNAQASTRYRDSPNPNHKGRKCHCQTDPDLDFSPSASPFDSAVRGPVDYVAVAVFRLGTLDMPPYRTQDIPRGSSRIRSNAGMVVDRDLCPTIRDGRMGGSRCFEERKGERPDEEGSIVECLVSSYGCR